MRWRNGGLTERSVLPLPRRDFQAGRRLHPSNVTSRPHTRAALAVALLAPLRRFSRPNAPRSRSWTTSCCWAPRRRASTGTCARSGAGRRPAAGVGVLEPARAGAEVAHQAGRASTRANQLDPRYDWAPLDRVVASAVSHGLKVMISISMPAPIWAPARRAGRTRCGSRARPSSPTSPRPSPRATPSSSTTTASPTSPTRASGSSRRAIGAGLFAPHLYRDMVLAAYPRIKARRPQLHRAGRRARLQRAQGPRRHA